MKLSSMYFRIKENLIPAACIRDPAFMRDPAYIWSFMVSPTSGQPKVMQLQVCFQSTFKSDMGIWQEASSFLVGRGWHLKHSADVEWRVSACPMTMLRIKMTESENQRGNRLTRVYLENCR